MNLGLGVEFGGFVVGGEEGGLFEVGFFVVDVLDVEGLGTILGDHVLDLLLEVRDGFDAEDGGVVGGGERLDDNLVVGDGLLVFEVDTVVLGVRGGGTLHGLGVLAEFRHAVGLE